jgi:hypothetical protein
MKGCLLLVGSIVGGLGVGLAVMAILRAVTGNDDLSAAIGTGAWLLAVSLIFVYASLWSTAPEEIACPPEPRTTIQRWRAAKAKNKLREAELRMGIVFALIGGATAARANGSNLVIAIAAIGCGIAGALIGFDVKRRVRRIRKRFVSQNDPESCNPACVQETAGRSE